MVVLGILVPVCGSMELLSAEIRVVLRMAKSLPLNSVRTETDPEIFDRKNPNVTFHTVQTLNIQKVIKIS